MVQYSQWLHYREVDQQLQTQLETLVKELAQKQELALCLVQSLQPPISMASTKAIPEMGSMNETELTHNQIFSALVSSLNGHTSHYLPPKQGTRADARAITAPPDRVPTMDETAHEPVETMPSHFPPSLPHSDMALQPEDMDTIFDQHAKTDPQIELPHWLRNITDAALATDTNSLDTPIDQESMRTNRLVQRWVERWGRHTAETLDQRKFGES